MDHSFCEMCLEFEERIAVYEAEISRLKKENYHQRKLLDAVYNPEVRLYKSDLQQLFAFDEEVSSMKQEWSPSLDQQEPKPIHIKEEEEELWSSNDEEQFQGLGVKAGITKLLFFPMRKENYEEKPHSSRLHQSQTEAEPSASNSTEQIKTESDEENCGPSEPARNLDQNGDLQPISDDYLSSDCCESETEDIDDGCNKTRKPEPSSDTSENNEISNKRSGSKPFSCSVCGKGFTRRGAMQTHIVIHTGRKPFNCSVCGKGFIQRGTIQSHMRIHTGEKPFSCSVCGEVFAQRGRMRTHMIIHTREKPFSCSFCGKGFSEKGHMQRHRRIHTGEKPFSCSVCGKEFSEKGTLKTHMIIHTGEKPFSCSVCCKRFSDKGNMRRHMRIHTGEKPFSCSVCGKWFSQRVHVQRHMIIHTEGGTGVERGLELDAL